MAKRAPKDEKPYNPIESALVARVAETTSPTPVETEEASTLALKLVESSTRPQQQDSILDLSKKSGREKRVILAWEDEVAVEELLRELSQDLRTPVKLSNALRSCVMLLRNAQEQIRQKAKQTGSMVRPPNNDQAAIAVFEHRLAALIQAGIKQSSSIE